MFLKGLNEATLLPLDALKFAEIAGKAGFDGVEFRIEKIDECFEKRKLDDLVGILDKYKIEAISLNALEDFSLTSANRFERMLKGAEFLSSNICSEINCDSIVAVPSFLPSGKTLRKNFIFDKTSKALEQFSRMAMRHGVKIALEFLGFSNCSVNNLDDAWKIVKESNLENLGLIIDTFHFYVSGSSLETLSKISPEKIFVVHVNDAPPIQKNELMDKHRILPGKGVIPLTNFLSVLGEIGYRGFLSIELFNEEYWKQNPKRVAGKALNSLKSFLEKMK